MQDKDMKKILDEMTPDKLNKRAAELEALRKQGKTLKEAAGVTDSMENEIYVLAKHYYDQGKYTEAVTIFEALSRINPIKYAYQFGLGSAFYQVHDYINALLGFFGAFRIDPNNPMAPYYVADCFVKLDAHDDAHRFLDLAIAASESTDPEKYRIVAERCKLIKATLRPLQISNTVEG